MKTLVAVISLACFLPCATPAAAPTVHHKANKVRATKRKPYKTHRVKVHKSH